MKRRLALIGIALIYGLTLQAASAALRCEANWKYGVYVAEGQAQVKNPQDKKSREKAIADAKKNTVNNMVSLIQKTPVNGINPAQVLAKNPVAKSKILGVVNTNKNLSTRFAKTGKCTLAIVTMKLPIYGQNAPGSIIAGAVQTENAVQTQPSAPKTYATELDDSHSAVIEPTVCYVPPEADNSVTGYTSLILDASGYGVKKSMCPRIVTTNGVVWAGETVPIDQVEEFGIAAYAKSLEAANHNPRCGLRPLIIRAIGSAGSQRYDVLVSDQDAELIINENKKSGFLDKTNVIIVTD